MKYLRILLIPFIFVLAILALCIYPLIFFINLLLRALIRVGVWTIRKIGYRDIHNLKVKRIYYPFGIIFGILKASLLLIRATLDLILLGVLSFALWILGPNFSGIASFKSYKKRILLRNKLKTK